MVGALLETRGVMRVLAGIDLSKADCGRLVDQAGRFATHVGGRLDLIYAAEKNHGAFVERLDGLLTDRVAEGSRGVGVCEAGSVVDLIAKHSKSYDVLVVGPRSTALERLLLGTIAIRVMRRAQCAVLVPRVDELLWDKAPRILLGADLDGLDPESLVAEAGKWTERLGGTLDVIYSDPHAPTYHPHAIAAGKEFADLARKDWEAQRGPQRKRLNEMLEVLPEANRGSVRIMAGGAEIVLEEASANYDIVAVGTRERSGLAGMLLGSVADHVIHNARCDVLTLPTAAMGLRS